MINQNKLVFLTKDKNYVENSFDSRYTANIKNSQRILSLQTILKPLF